MMAVNPADFQHVIVASHSPWKDIDNAGVLESKDGGETWAAHAPGAGWNAGTVGVSFLFEPKQGIGDANTWLVGTDGAGQWRTTNGGQDWTKVMDDSIPHGGQDVYYSSNGLLYAGATPFPIRSADNGATWEGLSMGTSFAYYYTVGGDGTTLYTSPAYTGTNGGDPKPFLTSPENDGTTWSVMAGDQNFIDGPYMMRFDAANEIMYSASWGAGLLALKPE
jgi:hypothetical protein